MEEVLLQNKKFISAKRASKVFGYAPDYIGQLCRMNKIECTRMGRTWFVNEESLRGHASQKEAEHGASRATQHEALHAYIQGEKRSLRYSADLENLFPTFTYLPDERPMVPALSKAEESAHEEHSEDAEAGNTVSFEEISSERSGEVSQMEDEGEIAGELLEAQIEEEETVIPIRHERRPMVLERVKIEDIAPPVVSARYLPEAVGEGTSRVFSGGIVLASAVFLSLLTLAGSAFLEDHVVYRLDGHNPVLEESNLSFSAGLFSQLLDRIR